jgi:3-methylcrotonyl-CoA carboxylase alpha subunit
VLQRGADFSITLDGKSYALRHIEGSARDTEAERDAARLSAPVHGRVLEVPVTAGTRVKRGQVLMLLECMKLEYRVTAPSDGLVEALHFKTGDVVDEGAQLLAFKPL